MIATKEWIKSLIKKIVPFRLGIDADGNYGYYKAGADTLTPFKSGGAGILYTFTSVNSTDVGRTITFTHTDGDVISVVVPESLKYTVLFTKGGNWTITSGSYKQTLFVQYPTISRQFPIEGSWLLTPVTSSNTVAQTKDYPGGTISASAENSTAFRAFNGDETAASTNATWFGTKNVTTAWLKYAFNIPVVVNKIIFNNNYSANYYTKTFNFEGSNDNSTWTVLLKGATMSSIEKKTFTISNTTRYKYYRVNITAIGNYGAGITELKYYGYT